MPRRAVTIFIPHQAYRRFGPEFATSPSRPPSCTPINLLPLILSSATLTIYKNVALSRPRIYQSVHELWHAQHRLISVPNRHRRILPRQAFFQSTLKRVSNTFTTLYSRRCCTSRPDDLFNGLRTPWRWQGRQPSCRRRARRCSRPTRRRRGQRWRLAC